MTHLLFHEKGREDIGHRLQFPGVITHSHESRAPIHQQAMGYNHACYRLKAGSPPRKLVEAGLLLTPSLFNLRAQSHGCHAGRAQLPSTGMTFCVHHKNRVCSPPAPHPHRAVCWLLSGCARLEGDPAQGNVAAGQRRERQ